MCRICIVKIQPRKLVRDHAGYTAPTRQHELSIEPTDHTDQEYICPERSRSWSRIDDKFRCDKRCICWQRTPVVSNTILCRAALPSSRDVSSMLCLVVGCMVWSNVRFTVWSTVRSAVCCTQYGLRSTAAYGIF